MGKRDAFVSQTQIQKTQVDTHVYAVEVGGVLLIHNACPAGLLVSEDLHNAVCIFRFPRLTGAGTGSKAERHYAAVCH